MADNERKGEDLENAYRQHREQIYRFLRRRTRSHEEAEDLTQRVFADAAASLPSSNPPDSLLAWLYAVAQRRFVDDVRRRQRTVQLLDSYEAAQVDPVYGSVVAQALKRTIGELPADQRTVVVMKVFEERSFAEIADELATTEAACKMRFSRAIRRVREELRREGLEP